MKKLLTLAALFLCVFSAQAQLPDGSTAPNFTSTDINGRTWTLYDILESGRPVLMDVSATWCGPCWSYHNAGHLDTYYEAHGPEGDGTSMVFWVEGDGATNLACMYGPSGCVGGTQGNWVAGTTFPMFNDASLNNLYDINYFPTIYLITPDKKVYEIGQQTATNLWVQASTHVGTIPANWGKVTTFNAGAKTLQYCSNQTINPALDMTNLGTSTIESMTIELRWNGQVVQTKEFTETVHVLDGLHVDFDALEITSAGMLSTEITMINGEANGAASLQEIEFADAPQVYPGNQVEVRLRTDVNGKDIYWAVYDDNGVKFDEGGNAAVGENGGGAFPNGAPADPTAYGNNQTISKVITVPGECFTFQIFDAVGDGLKAPGNVKLYTTTGSSIGSIVGNFGASVGKSFAEVTSGVTTLSPVNDMEVYPNPVSEKLLVSYDLGISTDLNFRVVNALGQVVLAQEGKTMVAGSQNTEIAVNSLSNGLYYLQIQSANGSIVAKPFVVAH